MNLPFRGRLRGLPGILILTATLTGCEGLFDTSPNRADSAQILVTGQSPVPLQLILSNQFLNVPDPSTGQILTSLVVADTFDLQLPIDQEYPMGSSARIFVRLIQPDSMQEANVTMRVLLDGKREVYEQQARLRNAFLEYTFTYQ